MAAAINSLAAGSPASVFSCMPGRFVMVWFRCRVLICVASDSRKKTPSSVGMKTSVETSELLKFRAETVVPQRTKQMIKAIQVPCASHCFPIEKGCRQYFMHMIARPSFN